MKKGTDHISCRRVTWLVLLLLLGSLGHAFGEVTAVSAQEAKLLIDKLQNDGRIVVLDIRTPGEYRRGHISGALSADYYDPLFKNRLDRLDRTKTYLVYCRSGNRSTKALGIFSELGFEKVYHLSRGVLEWQTRQFPLVSAF